MGPSRIGHYKLVRRIATGGMGDVFLARDAVGNVVALKRLHAHLADNEAALSMFAAEGRLGPLLSHPNLCQVVGAGHADGEHYLVMEYLEGIPFSGLVAPGGLRPGLVAGLIVQAADGLEYAHDLTDEEGQPLGLVHGDVCPENLFVTTSGIAKVLDFGIADTRETPPEARTGALRGKVRYMAPEQLRSEPLDRRADVYALAVCTYELITGRAAFDGENMMAVQRAVLEGPTPRLPTGDAPLDAALRNGMARDREERFPSVRELADAVAWAAGEPMWDASRIAQLVQVRTPL